MHQLKRQFDQLVSKLSNNQQKFLRARVHTSTDMAAYKEVGLTGTTISRWKKDDQDFFKVYVLASEVLNEQVPNKPDLPELPEEAREVVLKAQLESMVTYLPSLAEELVKIALGSEKDGDRLRAIEKIFELLGVGDQPKMPGGQQNKTLMKMLQLQRPQLVAAAKQLGVEAPPLMNDLWEAMDADD